MLIMWRLLCSLLFASLVLSENIPDDSSEQEIERFISESSEKETPRLISSLLTPTFLGLGDGGAQMADKIGDKTDLTKYSTCAGTSKVGDGIIVSMLQSLSTMPLLNFGATPLFVLGTAGAGILGLLWITGLLPSADGIVSLVTDAFSALDRSGDDVDLFQTEHYHLNENPEYYPEEYHQYHQQQPADSNRVKRTAGLANRFYKAFKTYHTMQKE